jgi:hypothetical protein
MITGTMSAKVFSERNECDVVEDILVWMALKWQSKWQVLGSGFEARFL